MSADQITSLDAQLRGGDFSGLDDVLADRFFDYVPGPDELSARDRILPLIRDLEAALPDLTAQLDDVVTEDDVTTAVLTVSGTHTGVLWGAPGSGNTVTWTTPVRIRSIADRLAIRFDEMDVAAGVGLLRQLHLVNPPDEMHLPARHRSVIPDFILKLVFNGQARDKRCDHLDLIEVTEPDTRVCARCVASGDQWPALRMCLVCGHVGCCDTSLNKHAPAHYRDTGHPIIRSIRMDEAWIWCYEDNAFFESSTLDRLRPST